MNKAGEDFYCFDTEDWVAKIYRLKNMKTDEREALAENNLRYVRNNYSDEALDLVWVKVFEFFNLSQ